MIGYAKKALLADSFGAMVSDIQYFDYERMIEMDLNPTLDSFAGLPVEEREMTEISVEATEGKKLVTVNVKDLSRGTEYAWLEIEGEVFDFQKKKGEENQKEVEYEVTVEKEKYHPIPLQWCVLLRARQGL